MCGIVHTPVTPGSLEGFTALHPEVLIGFEQDCFDYHIPLSAARFILSLAEMQVKHGKEEMFNHVPFAIYEDGMRLTSPFLEDLEAEMFHIAMAGSLMYRLNTLLRKKHGLAIILGHCCGADIAHASDDEALAVAYEKSHDLNVMRGDKIRGLFETQTQLLPWQEFVKKISPFAQSVLDFQFANPAIAA